MLQYILYPLLPPTTLLPKLAGLTFLIPWGDRAKEKKHGADARAAGYDLFPASFRLCA